MAACTSAGYYSGFEEVPADGWAYGDTIVFAADSCVAPGMLIALRHNDSYPYRNIWLEMSDSLHRDTVNIELCDIYGRWHGKGIGSSYQISAPAPFTPVPGKTVSIRPILRVATLLGIEQLELIPQP